MCTHTFTISLCILTTSAQVPKCALSQPAVARRPGCGGAIMEVAECFVVALHYPVGLWLLCVHFGVEGSPSPVRGSDTVPRGMAVMPLGLVGHGGVFGRNGSAESSFLRWPQNTIAHEVFMC